MGGMADSILSPKRSGERTTSPRTARDGTPGYHQPGQKFQSTIMMKFFLMAACSVAVMGASQRRDRWVVTGFKDGKGLAGYYPNQNCQKTKSNPKGDKPWFNHLLNGEYLFNHTSGTYDHFIDSAETAELIYDSYLEAADDKATCTKCEGSGVIRSYVPDQVFKGTVDSNNRYIKGPVTIPGAFTSEECKGCNGTDFANETVNNPHLVNLWIRRQVNRKWEKERVGQFYLTYIQKKRKRRPGDDRAGTLIRHVVSTCAFLDATTGTEKGITNGSDVVSGVRLRIPKED